MDQFLIHVTSYPTIIYTIILLVVLFFWLITVTGLFDFDMDLDLDIDVDIDPSNIGGALGFLVTLGLTGVPITLVLSLLVLYSWTICSISVSLLDFIDINMLDIDINTTLLMFMFNSFLLIMSGAIAIPLTAKTIKPLRKFFRIVNQGPTYKTLMGKSCRVRSSKVDQLFGQVECTKEGASLILNARAREGSEYHHGDIVVIIDYSKENNTYFVVSEQEFNQ